MAATGKTPILLYGSTTATNQPSAGNLTNSSDGCEIAINVADKNLFFKDSTNTVNTVPVRQSSASSDGWLSSADWSTFNGKAASFTYTTNYIPYGQGTTTPNQSSSFTFNGTTLTAPAITLASGNLTFSTTGQRITGDMSNATVANRVLFQTSTTNGNTTIAAIPNGTASITALRAYGSSDPANASLLGVQCQNGTIASILSDKTGTGTYVPLAFYTSGTKQLQIETTGNVSVTTGNLVIGTSGKGIDFSATAGTGTSELLADYEEGTFTPTWNGGTVTVSISVYTKIGRQVTWIFDLTFGTTSTVATSTLTLPFACVDNYGAGSINYTDYGAAAYVNLDGSSDTLQFRAAANAASLSCGNVASKRFIGVAIYNA